MCPTKICICSADSLVFLLGSHMHWRTLACSLGAQCILSGMGRSARLIWWAGRRISNNGWQRRAALMTRLGQRLFHSWSFGATKSRLHRRPWPPRSQPGSQNLSCRSKCLPEGLTRAANNRNTANFISRSFSLVGARREDARGFQFAPRSDTLSYSGVSFHAFFLCTSGYNVEQ